MTALHADTRSGTLLAHTVQVFVDLNQDAGEAARRLSTRPSTIRYRSGRFRNLTGLDVRRTNNLVTTWSAERRVGIPLIRCSPSRRADVVDALVEWPGPHTA